MFQPREIIYGYAKSLYSPHHKYIVIIYRDDELNIVACFTTSQSRAGVPEDEIHHGAIYKEKRCVSFVFEKDVKIGVNPATGADFAFPKRSVITFDYGVREGLQESFLKEFENSIHFENERICYVLVHNNYIIFHGCSCFLAF